MTPRYRPLLAALSLLAASALPLLAQSQNELEDLVDQAQAEEEKLQQLPGADAASMGKEILSGRGRLPKGEEVERLRISQDQEVDPHNYLVGPGDVFELYIWGEWNRSYLVQVDPEGNAIVPTVGSFAVASQTLAQAKEEILTRTRGKYPRVDITLTLTSMRYFTVYLTGAVVDEGSFVAHPNTRVAELIERGGGFIDDLKGTIEETVSGKKITRERQLQPQPTARRSIQLIHRDGAQETVDLELFRSTGEVRYNPYVRMGDVVHVQYRQQDIFVYGSVNKEGVQEYRPGDTVGTLLSLAGGVSGNAPLEVAEIWRFQADGRTTTIIPLITAEDVARQVRAADIAAVPLEPKDMLFVRSRSDWQQTPTVYVQGEVKYRGRYRIILGQTRIRDIIEQAGGFTERASLAEARLLRAKARAAKDPEYERLLLLQTVSGLADMSPEDKAYLKTKGREEKGRLAVDFQRLFEKDDQVQNVLLEGGDVVFVPERRRTVSLSGQMKKPGLVDFAEGRRASFYLEQAGGFSWNADKGAARLIRARTGEREQFNKNLLVEAGDEIWVPEKEYRNWWSFAQSTMRTVSETLTLILLVRAI
ncbi:MAG: SLBB domain-containing protein [Candidatus Latescibacteria bacterium]|nr:SLBB domain-containing protein [Candidatus Latescibacterota bacterium]